MVSLLLSAFTDHITDYITDYITDHITDYMTDYITDYMTDYMTDYITTPPASETHRKITIFITYFLFVFDLLPGVSLLYFEGILSPDLKTVMSQIS